jgi:hypothetical protein
MSRRLVKLQTLFAKLEGRYGAEDDAVREIGQQLQQLEKLQAERRRPTPRPQRPDAARPHAPRQL